MRLAFCISPTIGPPSSLSPLAHPNKRPVPEKIHPPDPRPTSDPHRASLSISHPRGPRSLGRDHSQHQCCLSPALFFSPHSAKRWRHQLAGGASVCFRGGEGDPRLHRCGPLSAAGSIPSPSAASPAPLQAKVCPESDLSFFPPSSALFGEDDLFKNRFDCGIQTRIEARFPPVRLPLAKKIPPSLLAPPK